MTGTKYRGYQSFVSYDGRTKTYRGKLLGIVDAKPFEATNWIELDLKFKEAVDKLIANCERPKRMLQPTR